MNKSPHLLCPAAARVVGLAVSMLEVRRVWLFGSRAAGHHHPASDIDLAFDVHESEPGQWSRFVAEVDDHATTLLSLDVVNMATCQAELRQEILDKGKIVYER